MTKVTVSVCMLALALLLAALPASGQGAYTVQGRVREQGSGIIIPGATVQLLGFGRFITDAQGGFRFTGVPQGRFRLNVQMLGYAVREQTVNVRGDVEVTVELEVEPIRIDAIQAGAKDVHLRGRVVQQGTGRGIEAAYVTVRSVKELRTRADGGFRVKVPAGDTVIVRVQALSFLPGVAVFTAERDTTLFFELVPDPVGRQMIAAQVRKLEVRTNGFSHTKLVIDRDRLDDYAGNVKEIIKYRLAGSVFPERIRCIYVDDRRSQHGMAELEGYQPHELYRIEILDKGSMIRIYTKQYIEQMLRNKVTLRPIVFMNVGLGVVCD